MILFGNQQEGCVAMILAVITAIRGIADELFVV
jgi:hypothetical protein